MRCATSYCNPTLLRKNLTRFWPIWALYTLIWVYALPVNCMMIQQQTWRVDSKAARLQDFIDQIPRLLGFGASMALCFGILTAMAMFSYLYNNRSAGLFHSLPLRREDLFLTGYLSGLICLLVPNALLWLLTVGTEALYGGAQLYTITVWLLGQSAMCLFFYSFAVFCAMFTGHLLALPAFYGILNFLIAALALLLDTLFQPFLYGYAGMPDWMENAMLWLTPAINLGANLNWVQNYETKLWHLQGGSMLWIYALAALVFAALALLVYRRRHVESAGDIVSFRPMRPVFKYGVALCSGLCFGYWLYAVFGFDAPGGLTGSLLLWSVIGYFAAEMLLKKSFRVLKAWKGCAVLALVVFLGITALRLDLTGFALRVPAPEDVLSADVEGMGSFPYDSGRSFDIQTEDRGLIHKTIDLHQAFVDDHRQPWNGDQSYVEYVRLRVTYRLTNGTTMTRNYGVSVPLDSPLGQAAEAFYCDPALAGEAYALDRIDPQTLLNADVSSLWATNAKGSTNWDLAEEDISDSPYPTKQAALLALYDAVMADYRQGALGKRYINNLDPERQNNTCTSDLTLYWGGVSASENAETVVAEDKAYRYSYQYGTSITLTPQAENTLEVLRALGVLTEERTLRLYRDVVEAADRSALSEDELKNLMHYVTVPESVS